MSSNAMRIFNRIQDAGVGKLDSAGNVLVPIHELRAEIRATMGDAAASPEQFDRALKGLRAEGKIRLLEVADFRDFTEAQAQASIPGHGSSPFLAYVMKPRSQ